MTKRIEELHPVVATGRPGVDDSDLFARAAARIYANMDVHESVRVRPMAVYGVRKNGAGIHRWQMQRPDDWQNEVCIAFVQRLNAMVAPQTTGAWIIGLGGWNPFMHPSPGYDQLFAMWVAENGDIPLVIDCEDHPHSIMADLDGLCAQAFEGWVAYATGLAAADVRADQMTTFNTAH